MSQVEETFFTSIGCMDGRVYEPVLKFGRQKFGAQFGDSITEAGLVGVLSQDNVDEILLESLRKKIQISLEKHHSKGIIVHGHEDCAGNPVDREKHKDDVRKAVEVIKSLANSSVPIIGVFVKKKEQSWSIEEV